MIFLVLMFFLAGIIAILLEAFLPFGVSAAIGACLIFFGAYLEVRRAGLATGILYCVVALGISFFLFRLTMRQGIQWMALPPPKTRRNQLRKTEASEGIPSYGESAKVVQPLRPTGAIEWHGRRFPARTLNPEREVLTGSNVRIRSRDSVFYLVEEESAPEPR